MTDVSTEPFENYYVIQKELGRGKFATVYQCQKHTSKELFAAKIIQTKSPANMKESLNEVEILRAVDHVGIVKCYDVYQSKKSLTMILELIGGGELFEKLANEDHVSEGQAASYCKQVLEALGHLHSLKIAHLDLKPENLMLSATDSDVIKIVDFGLAKRVNKRVVCMQGTAEFVPPEVISLDPLGSYSDMWSVGVIVYIMVSGYSPFMGDDDNQTYGNISMCDYEFYEEEFANISADCKDFINNLLVVKSSDRLSAITAMNHNWIVKRMDNENILENQKIRRFLAQRKWRALHKTIQSTRIFNSLLGKKNALAMKVTAPSVNMDHRKLMVAEGDSVSITAHIMSVKPTCSWSKDGTAIIVDKQKMNVIQSDTQSVLVISKFTVADEGHYTIGCSNPAGTTSATMQLMTLAPTAPSVSFEEREFVGKEGESVTIRCDLVADPIAIVTWENKSKKDLAKKSDRFTAKEVYCSATLSITKLKLADAGNYTVKARNRLGRGAASVQLKVIPKPIDAAEGTSEKTKDPVTTQLKQLLKSTPENEPTRAAVPAKLIEAAKTLKNTAKSLPKEKPKPIGLPKPKDTVKSNDGPSPKIKDAAKPNDGPTPKIKDAAKPISDGPIPKIKDVAKPNDGPTPKIKDAAKPINDGPTPKIKDAAKSNDGPTPKIKDAAKPADGPTTKIKDAAKPNDGPAPKIKDAEKPKDGPTTKINDAVKPNDGPAPKIKDAAKPKDVPTPKTSVAAKPKDESTPKISDAAKPKDVPTPKTTVAAKPKDESPPKISDAAKPKDGPTPKINEAAKPKDGPTPKIKASPKSKDGPTPKIKASPKSKDGPTPKIKASSKSKDGPTPKIKDPTKSKQNENPSDRESKLKNIREQLVGASIKSPEPGKPSEAVPSTSHSGSKDSGVIEHSHSLDETVADDDCNGQVYRSRGNSMAAVVEAKSLIRKRRSKRDRDCGKKEECKVM